MTINNRIEGIFRLTSPLHCASPEKSSTQGDNYTPTITQNIVTPSGLKKVPYFPGNDLRGRLRRKAAYVLMDHLSKMNNFTPKLYTGLTSGAISASPETSALSIEEVMRAKSNAFMGLVGGGARILRSRYQVEDLVPITAATIGAGMVPQRFALNDDMNFTPLEKVNGRALEPWELIQKRTFLRIDDLARLMSPQEVERYIQDPVSTIAAIQSEVLASRAARKENKQQLADQKEEARRAKAEGGAASKEKIEKVVKTDVGNMMTFETIAAGTPMYFRLDFEDDCSDAHVGLMLLALRSLVREQKLGGWIRAGLGHFDASLKLTRHGQDNKIDIFLGDKASDDAEFTKDVVPMVAAAQQNIAEQTPDGMMAFFTPRSEKVDEEAAA